MGLTDRAVAAYRAFANPRISVDDWAGMMTFQNNVYTYAEGFQQTLTGKTEEIEDSFYGYVSAAYKSNGVVFAAMLARMMLFSQARLTYRRIAPDGTPGELFGGTDGRNPANRELALLNKPWPNAKGGDLLTRAILDVDAAGNFYAARRPGRIKRMRPDWVSIVLGSESDAELDARDLDVDILGYIYYPGGRHSGRDPVPLLASEVAHWAPIPDPLATFRGMSWITPIVREITSDTAWTNLKQRFADNGATPNMVVALDKDAKQGQDTKVFREWVEAFRKSEPTGADAYRTMYLAGGTTVTVVGANLNQADFKQIQGAGETRIASAAGIHPVLLGLSEGLQGSSLNSGNFGAARRLTGDKTIRPLWAGFCGSMSTIITEPDDAELWYDDRHVPFLAEDISDRANVMSSRASTMITLINGGFKADDVVDAVEAEDLSRLKGKHTGLTSVQLQPPIDPNAQPAPEAPPPTEPPVATEQNGNGRSKWHGEFRGFWVDADAVRHLAGQHDQSSHGHGAGGGALGYGSLAEAAESGGFSVTTHGEVPRSGFMVSPYQRAERKYPAAGFSGDDVKAYRDNHRALLSRPDHYLGGWRDGDEIYLDVAVHTSSRTAAEALAKQHKQLAFYDLGAGETVMMS